MPDFRSLPDHIRHDPHMVDLRLTTLENRVDHISETHDHNRIHSAFTQEVKTPVGNVPAFIILALLVLIAIKPELVSAFLSR
jgi:hypothetical protein